MKRTEKIKNKLSFSIVDFVIIMLAVVLVIGIFARYDVIGKLFEKTSLSDAEITFVAEALSAEEASALTDGTKMYLDGSVFGTLSSVAKENSIIFSEDQSGKLISHESTELYDVTGTVSIKVLKTDSGYLLGGSRFISAGSTFVLKSSGVSVTVTVLSLNETDR